MATARSAAARWGRPAAIRAKRAANVRWSDAGISWLRGYGKKTLPSTASERAQEIPQRLVDCIDLFQRDEMSGVRDAHELSRCEASRQVLGILRRREPIFLPHDDKRG